jgi:hypothetical protein
MLGTWVCQIPCSYGKSYIGKIGRSFKSCLKDNITDTNHNHITKSVISKHLFKSKHLIFFDQTKISTSTPYHSSRLIQEVLEIEKHPNNFNCDNNYKLNQS